jgi:hypothetical protein
MNDVDEEFTASKYGGTADVVIAMSKEIQRLRALLALQTQTAQPEPVWCSCGDGIVPDTGALCGTCASLATPLSVPVPAQPQGWKSIDTAPKDGTREMFVVKAFGVSNGFTGGKPYTSDPWCVWRESDGSFARWPHHFAPTHWQPLAAAPAATDTEKQP